MEKEIFEWEEWDEISYATLQFYNCTIIKDFGPLKKEKQFETITIDFDAGLLIADEIKVPIKLEPK